MAVIKLTSQEIMEMIEEQLYQKGKLKRGYEEISSIAAVNFVNDEPDVFVFDIENK
jgi:hypothetical protein